MEQKNEVMQSSEGGTAMESIHAIHAWWLSQEKIEEMKGEIRKKILAETQAGIKTKLSEMKAHIQNLPKDTFISVKEEPFVFSTNPKARLLVEDVERLKLGLASAIFVHDNCYEAGGEEKLTKGSELTWDLCTEEEVAHLCNEMRWPQIVKWKMNTKDYSRYSYDKEGNCAYWKVDGYYHDAYSIDDKSLHGITVYGKKKYYDWKFKLFIKFNESMRQLVADLYISPIPEGELSLPYLLGQGFTPDEGMNPDFWPALSLLLSQELVTLQANANNTGYELTYNEADFDRETLESLADGMETGTMLLSYFQLPDVEKLVEERSKKRNIAPEDLFGDVLACDQQRCDLPKYKMQMLTDPNRGSWELWETEQPPQDGKKKCEEKTSFYARDPRQDVSRDGIIGIDFGTKSTVVTCLEDTKILPLRIGRGDLGEGVRDGDFENPTVMEFTNLKHFLEAYKTREGRPYTLWEDVDVSHTAANNRKNSDDSDDCAAFLGELKQWAGTEGKRIHVRDKKGYEKTLPPYISLRPGAFDPIELYAYYIGLSLNNQHRGKVYMRYILSFPVTYEKAVRERILESFRRGLQKSLPRTVVLDQDVMKDFRIEAGAGEPSAYAVCALQEMQKKGEISLSDEESLFYGVFDFGGGTSDFDFGTWRKAKKDKKEKRYNYVIRHLAEGGKQYLGGENLLKKLAYQVFKENADLLREKEIPFSLAPECDLFPGSEMIVNDSQEAETNMQRLMEKLRPFWQRETETAPDDFKVEKMFFFNAAGDKVDAVELKVDPASLEKVLKEELKEGIKSFLDLYRQVQAKHSDLAGRKCHILLAGRSSQSPLFQKLFREAIQTDEKAFEAAEIEAWRGSGQPEFFEIHEPLGGQKDADGEGAQEKVASKDLYAPNGKTGVAVGLLQCRSGGKIRVISESDTSQSAEIPFQFYIGEDDDGKFQAILKPRASYGKWVEFQYAMERDNEFFYTTNPSAGLSGDNAMEIADGDIHRVSFTISEDAVNEDHMIYLRPAGPRKLEYAVAESEEKLNHNVYTYGPETISLKE